MASKRPHPQGPEDHKAKQSPAEQAEHRHENAQQADTSVDQSMKNRSGESVVEGGVNEQRGEPPFGYGTEAPQVQGGGKR